MSRRRRLHEAPAWLSEVAEKLRENLKDENPPLVGTPVDASKYREATAVFFDPALLAIDGASFYQDAESAAVRGTARVFDRPTVPITAGFRSFDDACYFDLTLSLATWGPLASLTKLGLPLEDIELLWRYGPLATTSTEDPVLATSSLQFSATASLQGLSLPLAIVPPQKPGVSKSWQLSRSFDPVPLKSLTPLVQWLTKAAGAPALPALDELSDLALSGLELTFDPSKPRLEAGVLEIESTSPWPLVGQRVVLDNAALAMGFSTDAKGSYDLHAGIAATLALGDEVLQVRIEQDTALGLAVLELSSADATLPSFDTLAKLAGLPKLASQLPVPLRALTGLALEEFRCEVDSKAGKLSRLQVGLASTEDVDVAPKVVLENLRLSLLVAPAEAAPVTGSLTGILALDRACVALQAEVTDTLELSGGIDSLPLTALASRLTGGLPKWLPDIVLQNVTVALTSSATFHFDAAVSLDFAELLKLARVQAPEGMTDVHLSLFSLDLNLSSGTWNVTLRTDQTFQFPHAGEHRLALDGVALAFGLGDSGKLELNANFTLNGSVPVGDGSLTIGKKGLRATLGGSEWSIAGSVAVEAFGKSYGNWQAGVEDGRFTLSQKSPIKPVNWPGVAIATVETFDVSVGKDGFRVSGDGKMSLASDQIVVPAHLELDTTMKRLVFSSPNPKIPPLPVGPLTLRLQLSDLRLSRNGGWSFGSKANVQLDDIPKELQGYLPSKREGHLGVTRESVTLSCKLHDWKIDFPPLLIKLGDKKVPLGQPTITPKALDVTLGKNPALDAHLHVGIPRELNRLLGWDANFQPRTIFLNDAIDLRLGAGKAGFELALENGTSPLKALKIDAEGYSHWDLGEVGQFDFKVPAMRFDETSAAWSASFGMKHGPLRFPLQPVKFLMGQLGIPNTDVVPDSLPIPSDIDILHLGTELPKLIGTKAWHEVQKKPLLKRLLQKLFDAIGRIAKDIQKKYPVDFLEYLTLHVPDTIFFDVAASSRGPSFSLRTDDKEPLKFLLPWLASMPPGLAGFTLSEVSFGQVMGTLGLLTLKGRADFFDVVTLTVAALPGVEARGFRNRWTADRLTAVVPSAFPFPIPLYYDEVKWELASWTGLGLTSDWKLPVEVDLFQAGDVLIQFFTKQNYLLSRDAKDKALSAEFQIGPNFIALPSYLGGDVVGREGSSPVLPLGDSFKSFLDALKTGNLGYLIQSVPLKDGSQWIRIGKQKAAMSFGPLTFEAGIGWCIVTDTELREDVLPNQDARKILGPLDPDDVFHSLPTTAHGPAYDKGFLVMVMGSAGVRPVIDAQGYFGMLLTGPNKKSGDGGDERSEGGFASGFLMRGGIAELLSLTLHGDITIAHDRTTTVSGDCSLLFGSTELIGQKVTVTVGEGLFDFSVTIRLAGDACRLQGRFHISREEIFIQGDFLWSYAAGKTMAAVGALARFCPEGIALKLTGQNFFGVSAAMTLYADARKGGEIGARASIDVSKISKYFLNSFSTLADDIARSVAELERRYKAAAAKYDGDMNIIDGIRVFLTQLAKDLPGIVLKHVNDFLKKHTVPYPHNKIRKRAREEAKDIAGQLRELAAKLQSADAEQAKRLILALIQTVLDARVTLKFVGITVLDKSIWVWAPKEHKTQLQSAKAIVTRLPAEKLAKTRAKDVYDHYLAKKNFASEIAKAVADKVKGAIPTLTALQWETKILTALKPQTTLVALVTYKRKERRLSVRFDLSNPAKSAIAISRKLVDALAPSTTAPGKSASIRLPPYASPP